MFYQWEVWRLGDVLEYSMNEKVSIKDWKKLAHKCDLEEELPWKNIDVGVDDEFLKNEYKKALNGDLTPWCEEFGCYNCGAVIESNFNLIKSFSGSYYQFPYLFDELCKEYFIPFNCL